MVLWLLGMVVVVAALAGAIWVIGQHADDRSRRYDAAVHAAEWRRLQECWQAEPRARLATVQQVYASARGRGSRVRLGWTDNHQLQDVEIARERVRPGDFLLVRAVSPLGVIGREDLLARSAADGPANAQRGL